MIETEKEEIYRQTRDLDDLLKDGKKLVKQGYAVNIKQSPYFSSYQMRAKQTEREQPKLQIPKNIAEELDELVEECYDSDYIRSYSDVGAYMDAITEIIDEAGELYKFMFPNNDALLGCLHRNLIYLYLINADLVEVVE
ncbi:hypothetical protein ACFO26_06975 [Lactococcus nasutitermitis]|uniref:Phage protein n=1 Tax=Lactococcus nasutitermitis TaxID=1652957 RepID=A0ABV9JD94_9LACT|nr:hypothetical protein [Lactococcus nasutitermitis]